MEKPETDPWGTWVTGYSPVYDSHGNYVATVGADISASLVNKNLNRLLFFAAVAFTLALAESLISAAFHANKVTRVLKLLEGATSEVKKGNFRYRLHLDSNDEFQDLGNMMNQMNEWLEQNEKMKSGFSHYISQNMTKKLIEQRGTGKLEGEKRKITVLYSHIRDLHQFSQSMSPGDVIAFLNEYFKQMLEIIFKYDGMLDKLVGDGIIAEFGMPLEDPEQEKNAVRAAFEMHAAVDRLGTEWAKKSSYKIGIVIGIHTAETIVGTIDSENKLEYASIGEAMNIAPQIEKAAKEGVYPIIATESTLKGLGDSFLFEELKTPLLSESGEEIKIYSIYSV